MAHSQKPDFVFRRNGRVHLNRPGGVSSADCWHSRGVRISGSNAGYTMFRGSVKSIGYPPHSPVSPSLPLPCVTVCPHISTGFYYFLKQWYNQQVLSRNFGEDYFFKFLLPLPPSLSSLHLSAPPPLSPFNKCRY